MTSWTITPRRIFDPTADLALAIVTAMFGIRHNPSCLIHDRMRHSSVTSSMSRNSRFDNTAPAAMMRSTVQSPAHWVSFPGLQSCAPQYVLSGLVQSVQ
ncbi:hypothetical protein [Mycobacteroides chelonae]|uniref:hypothetical protein n=1 Tax=Mycobacteroides chelonae TaxID=1774 RepID=UPI0013F4D558|nr:hypothetical protein [Mycobacteroides chelonae]MBF9523067.1 hypothetical protein [Mycobacteroides chelonae]